MCALLYTLHSYLEIHISGKQALMVPRLLLYRTEKSYTMRLIRDYAEFSPIVIARGERLLDEKILNTMTAQTRKKLNFKKLNLNNEFEL